MKIIGTVNDIIKQLLDAKLEQDKLFIVELKEPKSKRTIQQNKYLWTLIHMIAKKTNHTDNEIYITALEQADCLSDYVITMRDMEEVLRREFRAVQFVREGEANGKHCYIYKVYLGSSRMNTKEMNELIDICIKMCADNDIPLLEYEYE